MAVVEFLQRVNLFEGLSEKALEQISHALTPLTIPSGTILFNGGDVGDTFFIVAQGEIAVFLTDIDTGVDIGLRTFKTTEYFGEMSLLTDDPRSASARALIDTNLLTLSRENFIQLADKLPSVAIALARELAKRIRQRNEGTQLSQVNLSRYGLDEEAFNSVPRRLLLTHKAIPVRRIGDTLTIAMVNPGNLVAIDDLRRSSGGLSLEPLAISEQDYHEFLHKHGKDVGVDRVAIRGAAARSSVAYISMDGGEKPQGIEPAGEEVIKTLNLLLTEAIDMGASDIHIEPKKEVVDIRYRVDGRLIRRPSSLGSGFKAPVVSRMKLLAGMDIAEKRMPQDGRIGLEKGGARIDLRVSTVPISTGEKVVLRILDPAILTTGLQSVVLAKRVCESVKEIIRAPYGLMLVSGPTGSGKTTTLYSILNELDRDVLNIVTVEDPIEYDVQDVTQTQVNEAFGLNFAGMIRGLLRQDPDVILIGEIRDPETARAAIDAALTGHLVMSSVHANDAVGGLVRLLDLRIQPFLLSNAVLGVINQRLVRRICPSCKIEKTLDPIFKARFNSLVGKWVKAEKFFVGDGCEQCGMSGYKGRVAVLEVLHVNERLKQMIMDSPSPGELHAAALDTGMVPMAAYAGFLVKSGVTTAVEAIRVLGSFD